MALALPSPADAFVPQGEGFAASTTGHLAAATTTRGGRVLLEVSGPDRRFGPREVVANGGASPFVAVGAGGDVLVVWTSHEGEDSALWAAHRPRGGPIGTPARLGSTASWGEDWPALGIDATGTAIVLWAAQGEPGDMMASIRQPDGVWRPTQRLGGVFGWRPALAVANSGHAVAAWRQSPQTGNRTQIAASTRLPGADFGPSRIVDEGQPDEAAAAINEDGDAAVAWSDGPVYGAFASAGGTLSSAVRLGRGHAPSVAVTRAGAVVAGWTRYLRRSVHARVRTRDGRLLPERRLTRDLSENTPVETSAAGRGAVAWFDRDPGVSIFRAVGVRPDGAFTRRRTLGRRRSCCEDEPDLLTLPDGIFWVRRHLDGRRPGLRRVRLP